MIKSLDIRTGCSGWSYSRWVGPFYPRGTRPSDYLKVYSSVFDTVEIDSSFYARPGTDIVEKWRDSVPEDFRFTAKMPQMITHDLRLRNSTDEAKNFLESMKVLGEKLAIILIQLPPSLKFNEGFKRLSSLLDALPNEFRYSVEVRDPSWLVDDTYFMLRDRNVIFAWSETPYVMIPPVATSDTVYIRFVGDRSIGEEEFGRAVVDRTKEVGFWAGKLKEKEDIIRHAYVLSNNHFQGFGPETVNLFRRTYGLMPLNWDQKTGQTRLL